MFSKTYLFKASLWKYGSDKGAWYFVTLPKSISEEIRSGYPFAGRSFGSVPLTVEIGECVWKTSIFPDSKSGSYFLPVKKDVRKTENLEQTNEFEVKIVIEL